MNTHTGKEPYVCKFCGKTFSNPKNLNVHLKAKKHAKDVALDAEAALKRARVDVAAAAAASPPASLHALDPLANFNFTMDTSDFVEPPSAAEREIWKRNLLEHSTAPPAVEVDNFFGFDVPTSEDFDFYLGGVTRHSVA